MPEHRAESDGAFEDDKEGTLHEMLDEESSGPSFEYSKALRANWVHPMHAAPVPRRSSFPWVAAALVFVLTTAFWGALLVSYQYGLLPGTRANGVANFNTYSASLVPYDMGEEHTIFSDTGFIGCGTSTEEARANGCVYDILANHYVHKSCYDEEGTASYMGEGSSWMGYLDKNKTQALATLEEMGDYDVYWTSQRDHIVHCGEMWKRQYRAFTQNWRYIDAITANEEHTYHCANYLVRMTDWAIIAGRDWRNEPNTVEVGFAGCYDRATMAKAKSGVAAGGY